MDWNHCLNPWKSKTKQRMVFRMIHVKDSLLPRGKVWSLDFLGEYNNLRRCWDMGRKFEACQADRTLNSTLQWHRCLVLQSYVLISPKSSDFGTWLWYILHHQIILYQTTTLQIPTLVKQSRRNREIHWLNTAFAHSTKIKYIYIYIKYKII